ncbi:sporulation protein [Domibacillus antri]|uniref:Sporulation protein n=1 Tax=Domibacillus antri TaxID=1714264 RepID=A0A1Q8Q726_9BACI|nr:YhcN/YlaJ family sporulation lipoprotein [Domibacillus antri]OLN23146.1 sporulation protein [Domibacillus antri]
MKKLVRFTIIGLTLFALAGCNTNRDEAINNDDQTPAENVNYEPDNNQDRDANETDSESRLDVADDAADRIVQLDEVETANVIVTDDNAYVAVVLRDAANEEVTNEVEDKIAAEVKAEDSSIQNVYVSANPDFVDRIADYREKINAREPVKGLVEEFSGMVQNVFPDAH